ncbi:MAG TPA: phosphatase PAP2 family protein [Xanthobacteraceae bacterium]|nr:phosphatase PAP2 family protein [Xanthobacteraceae bacterium]
MNRTGLIIALLVTIACAVVFGLHPDLDLKLAGLFYDPATKTFPVKFNGFAQFARDAAMWIAWAFAAPAIIAFVVKMFRPTRPLMMSGRAMAFLLITIILSAGILTNLTFKSFWGRPRPVAVTEFSGALDHKAWWDPSGDCPKNCSFFSGEAATAFWTYAPAALAPPMWRPLAYLGATVFGLATGVLRMSFGGHFFTDVIIAGGVTFIAIWLMFALIYRWPSTRWTDEGVDAALTRFAWPGYRMLQRLRGRDVGPDAHVAPATEAPPARAPFERG